MSFQQGLSGLSATSKSLDVIGNNIANASTYGAKSARAEFTDLYAAALNGAGPSNIGIGTTLATVAQQFSQGNIATTDNPMDLAINGAGFFRLGDGSGAPAYSRNGQFKIDREGFIVNNHGLKLMGYAADAAGVVQPGAMAALQLPTGGVAPSPTTKMSVEANLDARAAIKAPAAAPLITFDDPSTYNKATSLTVYDAKGQDIALTLYFQKSAADTWQVFASADGKTVAGAAAAPAAITTLNFDPSDGSFVASSAADFQINGATIALDFGKSSQYGSAFAVTDLSQNGFAAGQLIGVSVGANGLLSAKYSNGQTRPAGQVEIANFRNPQGLQPLGNGAWASSIASGDPIVGAPGEGSLGLLQAGALEESNVDLTGELVNMITAQRVYQANAQTIKTQDQVLQTLVNLR